MADTLSKSRTPALERTITADSAPSSSLPSVSASPFDTPAHSPSTSSLSSLDADAGPQQNEKRNILIDAYGNDFKLPDFTIKDIRDAIPSHCFERSGARGLSYVARDIVCLAVTFVVFNRFVQPEIIAQSPIRAALWALYTVIQGFFGTGLWVLAHECGHQSFSPSKTLNDTVGWALHSALLVPYFSWKISHGKHHKATGNMERDMVFVPLRKEQFVKSRGLSLPQLHDFEETPIYTALHVIGQQLFGWLYYLSTNVTGHNHHSRQPEGKGKGKTNGPMGGVNHFLPSSPLFEKRDERLILLSDLGLLITGTVLYKLGQSFGWTNMLVWYFIPYLWVNHWLVAITFLQHTDPSLPHYENHAWNFVRGAAATIDREFGFIGRQLFHGIIETHVLHHYVSTIPFYHADEATEAIRPIMGRHYRSDTRGGALGFLKSMWTNHRRCQWVEQGDSQKNANSGVLFFRNANGLGVSPKPLDSTASCMANTTFTVGGL